MIYNPKPDRPQLKEGVTRGWLVVTHGKPEPGDEVLIADAVAMVDEEGFVAVDQTGPMQTARVVHTPEERR